ncbi:MAG: hypothetical protein WBD56_16490 [Anaerolineales bacterium]
MTFPYYAGGDAVWIRMRIGLSLVISVYDRHTCLWAYLRMLAYLRILEPFFDFSMRRSIYLI